MGAAPAPYGGRIRIADHDTNTNRRANTLGAAGYRILPAAAP